MSPGSETSPRLDELDDPLLAEALDVHGAAGPEVGDALDALRGALDVGAEGVALAGETDEGLAAARALGREPQGFDFFGRSARTGPITSGMTSPALRTMHRVARADVFQARPGPRCGGLPARRSSRRRRRVRARRTASPARCGRSRPRSVKLGRALFGRELVGDRPSGCVGGRAELPLEGELVDLHDHAVDLVVEVVAVLLPVAAGLGGRVCALRPAGSRGSPGSPQLARERAPRTVARGTSAPSTAPTWYAQNERSRDAVIVGVLLTERARRRNSGDWRTLSGRRPPGGGSAPRTPRPACRPRRAPPSETGRDRFGGPGEPVGTARTVATLAVTSSPVTPSPRVAAWRTRRRAYVIDIAIPSIFSSQTNAASAASGAMRVIACDPGREARRRRRRCRGSSSGPVWRTGAKSGDGGAPTSGSASRRCAAPGASPRARELAHEVVVVGVGDLRGVVLVVAGAVVGDLPPQLVDVLRRSPGGTSIGGERRSGGERRAEHRRRARPGRRRRRSGRGRPGAGLVEEDARRRT